MLGQLRVTKGPDEGRTFDFDNGKTLTIGRSLNSDTQLKDFSVSRIHCQLRVADGKLVLSDNESGTGTFVNGHKITEQALKAGDTIAIGDTRLTVFLADVHDADTVAPASKPKAAPKSNDTILTGQTISHYTVGPLLAKGKTGTVYKALDTRDGSAVALKFMHDGFAEDEEDVQRFIRAMKTTIGLKHPNIVAIHGAGKTGPVCWVAMDFVDGESLSQVIKRTGTAGMLDWRYALTVGIHITRALEAAHAQHIIHRNIMPENVLITRATPMTARLGDLTLAKALDGIKAKAITRPGELVGDLVYMAPERTREGGDVDTRSDIYGLGALLYVLLTGHPPFDGGDLVETLKKIRQDAPVPLKKFQLSIPDLFQDIVLKMMAKRPDRRYQTPTDLLKDMERLAKFQGITL